MELETQRFKPYDLGRYVDVMPRILQDGRTPVSVARVFDRRVRTSFADWMDNYFDTGDLAAITYDGDEVRLVLTADNSGRATEFGKIVLGWINPNEKLVDYSINLGTNERYAQLDGKEGVIEISRGELGKLNGLQTKREASNSGGLRILLRHPDVVPAQFAYTGLFEETVPRIFSEYHKRFAQSEDEENVGAMGVYISGNSIVPKLKAFCVNGLGDRSSVLDSGNLGSRDARLVGEAPVGQKTVDPLEYRARTSLDAGRGFEHRGRLWVPVGEDAGLKVQ